jgi:hypothetical protein
MIKPILTRVVVVFLMVLSLLLASCSANMTTSTVSTETTTKGSETTQMSETTETQKNYELIWSDEFDIADGSSVDPAKWVIEIGNNRDGAIANCNIIQNASKIVALKMAI